MSDSSIRLIDARIRAAFAEVRRTAGEVGAASRMEPWNQAAYDAALGDWHAAKDQLAVLQECRRTGRAAPTTRLTQELPEPKYLSETELLRRGLTKEDLGALLGPPSNCEGERHWEFQAATESLKYQARRVSSIDQCKLATLLRAAYPSESEDVLRLDAQSDYERHMGMPPSGGAASDRVVLDYLRHQCTGYDSEASCAEQNRFEIKPRILKAIEVAFPWLTAMCVQERHRSAPDT